MAKNKKHERKQSHSARGGQQAEQILEPQAEPRASQVTPGDMARKGRQKRFGHN